MSPIFDQSEFDIRCEWGPCAVAELSPISDAVIVIDVLSFTTCVEVATSRGATVFPYRLKDGSAQTFAARMDAELAGPRGSARYSLSPVSLMQLPGGSRIVLPSPNGSTLSLGTGTTPTFAGCLRNAAAVARAAMGIGPRLAVIPAGERWKGDDSLRPALEDLLGAGAIISHLKGTLSPEARAAAETFQAARGELIQRLFTCSSGKELIQKGFEEDVLLAAELDANNCVPLLADGVYAAVS